MLQRLGPGNRWTVLDFDSGQFRYYAQHEHGFLLRSSTITF
jgi:serine phosphatase RsbU (regulator of sigma subunit)